MCSSSMEFLMPYFLFLKLFSGRHKTRAHETSTKPSDEFTKNSNMMCFTCKASNDRQWISVHRTRTSEVVRNYAFKQCVHSYLSSLEGGVEA
mmetsp:Transcript_94943/g.173980  ORF Transcript_94943/g.173980 Transcript_94943/m.173980 type:complete len:92 (+) Transcript_94943:134-409(+)